MKCFICDKNFFSLEWYKLEEENGQEKDKLIMCDECVLSIYKSKKSCAEAELRRIDNRIKFVKDKIGE